MILSNSPPSPLETTFPPNTSTTQSYDLLEMPPTGNLTASLCQALDLADRCHEYVRYLPAIGRFLIVVTFLEDALRILTQWNDQLVYLHDFRHSMSLSDALDLTPPTNG